MQASLSTNQENLQVDWSRLLGMTRKKLLIILPLCMVWVLYLHSHSVFIYCSFPILPLNLVLGVIDVAVASVVAVVAVSAPSLTAFP